MAIRKKIIERMFWRYQKEIERLIEQYSVVNDVNESLDANYLAPDVTAQQLLDPALNALLAHEQRFDNPHEEDADSIGTYSREYLLDQLSGLLRPGILPVSTWGFGRNQDLSGDFISGLTKPSNSTLPTPDNFYVDCVTAHRGLLSGTPYRIEPQRILFDAVNTSMSSRCHYALDLVRDHTGVVKYQFRPLFDTDVSDATVMPTGTFNHVLSTHPDRLTIANYFVYGYRSQNRNFYITQPQRGTSDASSVWTGNNPRESHLGSVMRIGKNYIYNSDARVGTNGINNANTGIPDMAVSRGRDPKLYTGLDNRYIP